VPFGFELTKDGNIYFIRKPGEGLRGMGAVGTSSFGSNRGSSFGNNY